MKIFLCYGERLDGLCLPLKVRTEMPVVRYEIGYLDLLMDRVNVCEQLKDLNCWEELEMFLRPEGHFLIIKNF